MIPLGGIVVLLTLALLIGGIGWIRQPSSVEIEAAREYIRSGNELVDAHKSITSEADFARQKANLIAIAKRGADARTRIQGLSDRKRKWLDHRFDSDMIAMSKRLQSLVKDYYAEKNPAIVIIAPPEGYGATYEMRLFILQSMKEFYDDTKEWQTLVIDANSIYARASAKAVAVQKSEVPATPQPFDPAVRLRELAGTWDAKDFTFIIQPNGTGSAEFRGKFSQGTGFFSVSDKNGLPVILNADFNITFEGKEPRFAFVLEPDRGLRCQYSFAVLPESDGKVLVVRDLAGKRTEENPTRMQRRSTASPVMKGDNALEGNWYLETVYLMYTGKESQQSIVTSEHSIRIAGDIFEEKGVKDDLPQTAAYALTLDTTTAPKRFKIVRSDDPNSFQEGVYRIDGDMLLFRTLKHGTGGVTYTMKTDGVRLDKNPEGKDADVPAGFRVTAGDKNSVFRYRRVRPKPAETIKKALDIAEVRRALAGTWDAPNLTLAIDATGKGTATTSSEAGGMISIFFGYFDVAIKNDAPHIGFEFVAGTQKTPIDFQVLSLDNPQQLVAKEANGNFTPNPITFKRRAPAPEEKWEDVANDGRSSRVVVTVENDFYAMYGGKVAIEAREVPGKGFVGEAIIDAPGSIWLIAQGGIPWKGQKFPEGSIVTVDASRTAKLTQGDYSAWFTAKQDFDVYANADDTGEAIATVKADSSIRILIPAATAKGLHKIRLNDAKKTEGWVRATWEITVFKKSVKNVAQRNTPSETKPLISGKSKFTEVRRWETDDDAWAEFSPDGRSIVHLSSALEFIEWDAETGKKTQTLPAPESMSRLAISPDFRFALTLERPDPKMLGKLHIWDVRKGTSRISWPEPKGKWETYHPIAAFSADGLRVATLYSEPIAKFTGDIVSIGGLVKKELFLWDAEKGAAIKPFPVSSEYGFSFTSDGKNIITEDDKKQLQISDAKTGKKLKTLSGAPGRPSARGALYADDDKLVVAVCSLTGTDGYAVVVWNVASGVVVQKLEGLSTYPRIDIAKDGQTLLVAESGEPDKNISLTLRLWNVRSGTTLGKQEGEIGTSIYHVKFASNGGSIVTSAYHEGTKKGLIQHWNIAGDK